MKGIENLIASIVLIAIVIAMGVGIFSWQQSLATKQTQSAQSAADCGFVSIIIDEVAISDASKEGRVLVRNTGSRAAQIVDAKLYSTANIGAALKTTLPVDIPSASVASIAFDTSTILCADFNVAIVRTTCANAEARFSGPVKCA